MNAIIKWRSYSLRAKKILFFPDYNHKMKINTTASMEDLQKTFIFSAARKIRNPFTPSWIWDRRGRSGPWTSATLSSSDIKNGLNPTKYFNTPHIFANIWKFISAEVVFLRKWMFSPTVYSYGPLSRLILIWIMHPSACRRLDTSVFGTKISYAFLIDPTHNNIP